MTLYKKVSLCIFTIVTLTLNVSGKAQNSSSNSAPVLMLSEKTIDVLIFPGFTKLEYDVVIGNTGNEILEIRNIKTSCGCIHEGLSDPKIEPGQESVLTVKILDQYLKPSTQTIQLITNDPKNKIVTITISSRIPKPVEVIPENIVLSKRIGVADLKIKMFPVLRDSKINIRNIFASTSDIKINLSGYQTEKWGITQMYTITATEGAIISSDEIIIITTDDNQIPLIEIPIIITE